MKDKEKKTGRDPLPAAFVVDRKFIFVSIRRGGGNIYYIYIYLNLHTLIARILTHFKLALGSLSNNKLMSDTLLDGYTMSQD